MSGAIEKFERFANAAEKLGGVMKEIPRLAEMFGVGIFAGRASRLLGGSFEGGFIGGVVADGLAHSNIPHNQIGGVALAAYFSALGLINVFVAEEIEPTFEEKQAKEKSIKEQFITVVQEISADECSLRGGRVLSLTGEFEAVLFGIGSPIVQCELIIRRETNAPDLSAGTERRAVRFLESP